MTMEVLTNFFNRVLFLPINDNPPTDSPMAMLKPLPVASESFAKELKSLQNLDRYSEPTPRAKLYHNVLSTLKIKRPFESTMILLVGVSGVGKSSTVNHLLDTEDGFHVAATSSSESETRKTTEYILTIDDPSFEVRDLKMSVIDTPGFNDTAGVNQDACNFVSIKKFFETHPRLVDRLVYPNLVFLMVSATDQRIKGPNSNLSQCLRGIKLLEVVDTNQPNLVVVITFCCSVRHTNVSKWEKIMQEKKDLISTVVYEVLGIRAPVVLIENDFDDLTKVEDFTLLPNDERQPKNLYDACQELLERNKDHFGLMVFNAAFEKPKRDRPTNGHEVEAKDSSLETLSDEEEEFSDTFSKTAKGSVDPIGVRAMEFVKENKLDKIQQEEIFKIVETIKSMGLSSVASLQSVSIGEIRFSHGEISEQGFKMLEQKFGIKNESVLFNSAEFVGQGYNIIVDKPVPSQLMTFSTVDDTKFGLRVPACAQIVKGNETREYQMDFQSDESYVKSRLHNLGLNIDLAQSILTMAPKFGVNASLKNDKSDKSKKTTKTSLTEYRIFKLSFCNFETKEIAFTQDFLSAVQKLPEEYTEEETNKQEFEKFFNRFGHYVITSAYIGGAVEKTTCVESLERSKHDETSVDGSVGANVSGVVGGKLSGKTKPSVESAKNAVLNTTEMRWYGGQSDLHIKSTLESEEKMLTWKRSLSKEPALLTNEMSLEPISTVVSVIDKTKGDICYQALHRFFHGDLKPVRTRQDEIVLEEKKKMENDERERLRKESNTRAGSTKQPDTAEWWETISGATLMMGHGGSMFIIQTAIVFAIAYLNQAVLNMV